MFGSEGGEVGNPIIFLFPFPLHGLAVPENYFSIPLPFFSSLNRPSPYGLSNSRTGHGRLIKRKIEPNLLLFSIGGRKGGEKPRKTHRRKNRRFWASSFFLFLQKKVHSLLFPTKLIVNLGKLDCQPSSQKRPRTDQLQKQPRTHHSCFRTELERREGEKIIAFRFAGKRVRCSFGGK